MADELLFDIPEENAVKKLNDAPERNFA